MRLTFSVQSSNRCYLQPVLVTRRNPMNNLDVRSAAIIGLVSIAIQHIMDENYDKAQDTLRGLIISLEGGDKHE